MRISERQRYDVTSNRIEVAKGKNAKNLDLISSQKRITRISDDPIGASTLIRSKDLQSEIQQYQRNIDFAQGFLNRSEIALAAIHDKLVRAKELAVQQSSNTYDQESRNAIAVEINEIVGEVVQLGNSSYNGKYVFAGFRNASPAVSMDGDFLGDDGAIYLNVSADNYRRINIDGRRLFEADADERKLGHFNLVDTLGTFYGGLVSGDIEQIRKASTELDFQMEKAVSFRASIGAVSNSFEDANRRLEGESDYNKERISAVRDTDIYEATSEFKRTEAMLQSSLLAANKVLQPSLLNFLQ